MIAFALSGLMAAPLMAQTAPTPAAPQAGAQKAYEGNKYDRRQHGQRGMTSMSAEGRQIMQEARRKGNDPTQRAALQEARTNVMTLLSADQLDVNAVRRAMDAERKLVDQQHARRQANMLEAFQKLSAEDRKAFAADAHAGRDRLKQRMERRNMQSPTPAS